MIIDFHAHIFPDALAARGLAALTDSIARLGNAARFPPPVTDMTLAGLTAYMDTHGIGVSVIQPVITKQSQLVKINEWAAGVQSERIISFGGIYPHTDDYRRDIDFVAALGLKGLKFHAEYQDFVLDSPEMLKIYDYALSKGLIILHHAGFDPGLPPPFKTSPKQFANLADTLRGGVTVAAHLGGHAEWDDVESCLAGKNIYLDTSMGFGYYSDEQFLRIVKKHGSDKLLFASDSPWSDSASEAAHLRSLPLSDSEKEKILGKNAAGLLNLAGYA